jgi:hypothetical protein
MLVSQSRYTADETVQLAEDLYRQRLRSGLEEEHRGQYIAIDVETGDYEIGDNYHTAAQTILSRKPEAAVGVLRIGYPAVGRLGRRVNAVCG